MIIIYFCIIQYYGLFNYMNIEQILNKKYKCAIEVCNDVDIIKVNTVNTKLIEYLKDKFNGYNNQIIKNFIDSIIVNRYEWGKFSWDYKCLFLLKISTNKFCVDYMCEHDIRSDEFTLLFKLKNNNKSHVIYLQGLSDDIGRYEQVKNIEKLIDEKEYNTEISIIITKIANFIFEFFGIEEYQLGL